MLFFLSLLTIRRQEVQNQSVRQAGDSQREPFLNLSKTIKSHWGGVLAHFKIDKLNNDLLEGVNTKIQLDKRRARGFSNIDNFIHMTYFISGKLKLDYTHNSL